MPRYLRVGAPVPGNLSPAGVRKNLAAGGKKIDGYMPHVGAKQRAKALRRAARIKPSQE